MFWYVWSNASAYVMLILGTCRASKYICTICWSEIGLYAYAIVV